MYVTAFSTHYDLHHATLRTWRVQTEKSGSHIICFQPCTDSIKSRFTERPSASSLRLIVDFDLLFIGRRFNDVKVGFLG